MYSISFFGEITSWLGVNPDPSIIQAQTHMPPPNMKKELQSFMGILNYLHWVFTSDSRGVWAIMKPVLGQTYWIWNRPYQDLHEKAKKTIVKRDESIKFYDTPMQLYLETKAYRISLGARLLQVRHGMNCEALRILHGLERFPPLLLCKESLHPHHL